MKLADLRRAATTRSLFAPTSLAQAIERLGYVQADPIRAPARAQDLILRHRVRDYRAGDLERLYPTLPVEEDYLHNYGFVSRALHAALHPRPPRKKSAPALEAKVLAFLQQRAALGLPAVHPREVQAALGTKSVGNAWGGSSAATTKVLDGLHYAGVLRVQMRVQGTRVYMPRTAPSDAADNSARARAHRILDAVLGLHAPLPAASLTYVMRLLRYGAPHQAIALRAAFTEAEAEGTVRRFVVDGVAYVDWTAPPTVVKASGVRFLAPFDPIVWDRRRFHHLFGWEYKFEAYTPPAKRRFGYYAMPILWNDAAIGWVNVDAKGRVEAAYVKEPKDATYRRRFAEEVDRLRWFLGP